MNVCFDRRGDIVILTLNRPHRLNSLDDDVTRELLDGLERVSSDPSVGALVLSGSGRAFSAGGDLSMLADRAREVCGEGPMSPVTVGLENVMRENGKVVELLRTLHCPSIAAVNGACVGAGLALAAACDLRLASSGAFFDTAYLRLGLSTDFGVSWLLHDLLGTSAATDWLLRPRRITAAEAMSQGLVGQVIECDDPQATLNAALKVAQDLVQARVGVRALRENLHEARQGATLAAALDAEAKRFVAALRDPETSRRVTSAGTVASTTR
jgi:2-(1,2-epoxy-1,2-dihydrophenyl)acetyl-CoA isomerase